MIDLESLPTWKEEMVKLRLEFPRLDPDSPRGCPRSLADIKEYIAAEGAEGRAPRDLFFGRTALIGEVRFWLWGYVGDDGLSEYVFVGQSPEGSVLGMAQGEGFTPEQFLALQYARWWRDKGRSNRI